MDYCPPELVLNIASYACVDGGKTGCSLSLVSRYIRGATARARYQSVALFDPDGLLSFANLVTERHVEVPPLHLFVSLEDFNFKEQDGGGRAENALALVLLHVSPTLRALTIHCINANTVALTLAKQSIAFLELTDLSISDFFLPSSISIIKGRFPSLRRLHVSHDTMRFKSVKFFEALASTLPTITHLRFAWYDQDGDFAALLCEILRDPASEDNNQETGLQYVFPPWSDIAIEARKVAETLEKLKVIIVQLAMLTPDTLAAPGVTHEAMETSLENVAREDRSGLGRGQFILLPASPEARNYYTVQEAKKDWLDLVGGGDGPWSLPETSGDVRSALHI
ncbi:uncharacterized protein PHACADRAFT_188658 [Phanerochaete carnosa HHB-10118-sp]|uniref:F-box domain-containing protein n=1 Tax=Phanerochaete carnosa (strain HHB-10118-sp) TaxID=650164 RepID=K5WH64_PHACS|nr:uncharacterized protein PHACADRAFT_188658 [Phanerochaete carnosa HHB-10118-sp]EKM49562.1 hypothetical protein PHACADRAFT_188658 [Phanerochaete carnosa HHB-10118-sp]